MNTKIIMALAILILAAGITACTEKKDDYEATQAPPPQTPSVQETTPPPTQVPPATEPTEPYDPRLKVFKINASNWKFEPNEIRVFKGDRVRIYLTSLDVAHGFAIYEGVYENISMEVPAGETKILEFNATEPGIYEFKSNVYSGAGTSNMKGVFVVYGDPNWKTGK